MSVAGSAPVRSWRGGGSRVWWAVTAGLVVALVLAPGLVAGWVSGGRLSVMDLPDAVAAGFAQWVRTGQRASGAELSSAVAFWAAFHVVKAVVAAVLLAVVVRGCRRSWSAYAQLTPRGRRFAAGAVGVVGALAATLLLLIVVANVQGAVAPLSSVLSMLPMQGPAVAQVSSDLAAGRSTPVTAALTADFRLYHAALAVTLVPVTAVLVGTVVRLWVRRSRIPATQRRARRVLAAGGTLLPVFVVFLAVVLAANVSTVADTAPALSAFFDGGGGM